MVKRKILSALCALSLVLGLSMTTITPATASENSIVVLGVEPATGTSIGTGESFDLEVWARFSVGGHSWNSADVIFQWDPTYLRLDGGTFSPTFPSGIWPAAGGVNDTWADGDAGIGNLTVFGEGNEITSDQLLITLHVTALTPVASTTFNVVHDVGSGPSTMVIEPGTFTDLSGTYHGAEVNISSAVYVNGETGSDATGDGSHGNPWATIQHAVNSASAGDIINVAAGTYNEQITITKGLTIQGAGDNTVIKPSQATITGIGTLYNRYDGGPSDATAIVVVNEVSTGSVILKDFKVDLSLASSLASGAGRLDNIFYRNSNGTIDGVTVIGLNNSSLSESNDGIRCAGFGVDNVSVEIKNCDVSGYNKNGITCNEAKLTASIHNNTTTGLGGISWSAQNGIQVGFGAAGTIADNMVSDNVYTGASGYWSSGILVYQSDGILVSGNTVSHSLSGIYIQQSSSCTVSNNTVANTTGDQAGIMVSDHHTTPAATGNVISGNTITGGWAGIWSSYCSSNTYSGNTISGCTGNGIYFWDTDGNIVSGNTISLIHDGLGTGWGIVLDGGDTPTGTLGSDSNDISSNTIKNNDYGVWVGNSSDDTTLSNNIITFNLYGVVTGKYSGNGGSNVGPTNVTLSGNNICNNDNYAVENTTYDVGDPAATTIVARDNWWGHATGPKQATSNPHGLGDEVSDNVDYTPWYLMPKDEVTNETEVTEYEFGQQSQEFTGTGTTLNTTNTSGNGNVTVTTGIYVVPSDATHPLPVDVSGSRALKYVDVQVSGYSSGTVTITISYSDDDLAEMGVEESSLALYYFNMGDEVWILADNSAVDTVNNTVSGDIPVSELSGTPLCLGGDEEVTGQYEVGEAPVVTVSFTPLEMDPQVEQTVTVNVSVPGGRTLEELSNVIFKVWYDSDGGTPSRTEFNDALPSTQQCAVINWTPGGGFILSPMSNTTWAPGTCTAPTLTSSSGDFTLKFTPGKVAQATSGLAKWQMAAIAISAYGTGFGYDAQGAAMNWYGEMVLGSATNIDWGSVPSDLDFADSAPSQAGLGTTITYISNGDFDKKAKSSAAWVGATYNATLDSSGVCDEAQEFALKVDNALGNDDAALLDSTGVVFDNGGLTLETGGTDIDNYLWLKLAGNFAEDVYSGMITYIIANGS